MAEPEAEKYQVVLGQVPAEKQPETALFLSACFSLPPSSTRSIAASAPIALIADMSRRQAEAVLEELAATLPQGIELCLASGAEASDISRLQWPRPPQIYGRDLAEFPALPQSQDLVCPLCGGSILLVLDDEGNFRLSGHSGPEREDEPIGTVPNLNSTDPIFSGVKPIASESAKLASVRFLSAGDTGFWGAHSDFSPPAAATGFEQGEARSTDSSRIKRQSGKTRTATGLAAFMKPGVFALVVSRTRDAQAIKMIAEIMGVSEDEARDKCMGLGLCVARDISLDEAQSLLERFRGVGAKARIVKPA